jgi:hypothetical protein
LRTTRSKWNWGKALRRFGPRPGSRLLPAHHAAALAGALTLWGAVGMRAQNNSGLTSLYFSSVDHVYYIGANQHVEQLVWTGSAWANNDLTTQVGNSVLASGSSGLTSLYFSLADHVYYIGSNQHVEQLMWTGSGWANNDLTAQIGNAVLAEASSALTSLYFASSDHIYYIGSNQHVEQLVWTGSGWANNDLSANAGASVLPAANSGLTSLYFSSADRVYYIGTNQHVEQLTWTGSGWANYDLTAAAGTAELALATGGITSLYFNTADHVYYIGANQHIHELMWTGSAWIDEDLTGAAGAGVLASQTSGLTSLYFSSVDHVYYIGVNHHVEQLVWTGSRWANNDLTGQAGNSVLANVSSALSSLYFNSADHIYYFSFGEQLNELIWNNPGWINVSAAASAGAPAGYMDFMNAANPAKEYIYLNGKAVAVENDAQ